MEENVNCRISNLDAQHPAELELKPNEKIARVKLLETGFGVSVPLSDACVFALEGEEIQQVKVIAIFRPNSVPSIENIIGFKRVSFSISDNFWDFGDSSDIPSDLLVYKPRIPECLRDYDVKTDGSGSTYIGWYGEGIGFNTIDFTPNEMLTYKIKCSPVGITLKIGEQKISGKITLNSPILDLLQKDEVHGYTKSQSVLSKLYTVNGECTEYGVVCSDDFLKELTSSDLEVSSFRNYTVSIINLTTNEILVELGLNDKMVYDFHSYQLYSGCVPKAVALYHYSCDWGDEIAFKCKQSVFFYLADLADKIVEEKKEIDTNCTVSIKNKGELETF